MKIKVGQEFEHKKTGFGYVSVEEVDTNDVSYVQCKSERNGQVRTLKLSELWRVKSETISA